MNLVVHEEVNIVELAKALAEHGMSIHFASEGIGFIKPIGLQYDQAKFNKLLGKRPALRVVK